MLLISSLEALNPELKNESGNINLGHLIYKQDCNTIILSYSYSNSYNKISKAPLIGLLETETYPILISSRRS